MKKLTILILISLITFSCNKKDDPQPTSNNNGTTPPPTTTNTPPTVSATPSASTNPTTITINATDTDGTISKVEVFNGSTLLTTLTTSPYIYTLPTLANGSYTYTIKATDNSNAVSSTTVSFTVSISNPKSDTEALLSNFIGRVLTISFNSTLQYEGTTLTINSNGTLSSNSTESMFYGDNANVASGRYVINDDGTIAVRPPIANVVTIYTVSKPNSTTLRLTLDNGDYFEFN
jgi:hypothetical protein